jgi:cytochrome c peroxidase
MKKSLIALTFTAFYFFACHKSDLVTSDHLDTADSSDAKDFTPMIQPMSDDYDSIPQDPQNPLNAAKVELGKLLFHETRLGINPRQPEGLYTYSCASCHHAEAGFQSGLTQAISEGGSGFGSKGELRVPSAIYQAENIDIQPIRAPSLLNSAFQSVMLWNGELGGVGVNIGTEYAWTNDANSNNFTGLSGLEILGLVSRTKHRLNPDTAWLASNETYKNLFDLAFPELPDAERITSRTVSLALAAYQRTLIANQSPFQLYLRGDKKAMTKAEKDGKTLFFGKAKCSNCHNSPALNSMQFVALGMNDMQEGVDGAINIIPDNRESKGRGGFTGNNKDMYKFKVPQLYNLRDVTALGHGGSFHSVEEVVRYMNAGVPQNQNVPLSQISKMFKPLLLTEDEIGKLAKFVNDALYDPNLIRYVPASVPSGNCIPNNDDQSRIDRGCQ